MKFIITTFGSAGDVHPFMAMALQLQKRGHEAVIVTSGKFAPTMEKAGIRCVPLGTAEDFDGRLADPRLWDPNHALEVVLETVAETLEPTMAAITAELGSDARDVVLIGSSLGFAARILRDRLGIPMASVHLAPSLFWSKYAPPCFDPRSAFIQYLPAFAVGWFYRFIESMIQKRFAGVLNARLRAIGYGEVPHLFSEWIHSPDLTVAMFPDWFAAPQRDWPQPHFLVGFPRFAEDHVGDIEPELAAFLAAGEAPIAFAPGSANTQGADFFRESAEACLKLGRRGVFITPAVESIPRDLPAEILHVRYVPFARLFPRCAAVVHHGGIGTTAQCFAAGVPQLVMPMAHDQFDNASRVERLGVGRVLPAKIYRANPAVMKLRFLLEHTAIRQRAAAVKAMDKGADWDGLITRLEQLRRPR